MTGRKKALIGAAGGLALALIFLVKSGFLVTEPGIAIIGGYLTALAFVVLGALVGGFAPEEVPFKIFIFGVIAPSLLTNIIAEADSTGQFTPLDNRPIIESVPSVPVLPKPAASDSVFPRFSLANFILISDHELKVKILTRKDVGNTLADGVRSLIEGRKTKGRYAFVVGATPNESQALDYAQALTQLPVTKSLGVQVLRAENKKINFVTIGGFLSPEVAAHIRNTTLAEASTLMPWATEAVAAGRVVDLQAIFN